MTQKDFNTMKIYTDSYDINRIYKTKEGYLYKGNLYDSLSKVKREYRQTRAVELLLKLFAIIIIVVSSLCSGIILLSIINIF